MSTALRQQNTWVGQNYEKLILVVILLVLLGSSGFLLLRIGIVRKQLTHGQWDQPPPAPRAAKPVDLAAYGQAMEILAHPFQMPARTQRFMTSELRVGCVNCRKPIMYNTARCPFCGTEQPEAVDPKKIDLDGDGMPDWWETKYGLNPSDRNDAQADMDGDGFTNVEEFLAETDPKDPKDYPSPPAKLRLRKVVSEPFFLRFQAVNEISAGVFQYQLNLRTLQRTYFAKIGEDVEGFKVVEYLPAAEKGPTVVMQQGEKKIHLVKGQAVQQEEYTAQLIFLLDRTPMLARIGDVITLKGQDYKVIDIRRSSVLIRDVKTGKDTQVPLLAPGDLSAGAPGGSAGPGSQNPEPFPE